MLGQRFAEPLSLFLGYLVLASARFVRPCARAALQLAPPTTTPFPRKVEAAVHVHVARPAAGGWAGGAPLI